MIHNGDGNNYKVGERIKLKSGDNNAILVIMSVDDPPILNPEIYNYEELKKKVNTNLTDDEKNNLIVSHDVSAIDRDVIYANYSASKTSTLNTIPGFDINSCQPENSEKIKSSYVDVVNDNNEPLKKYCGNTNQHFIKNKRLESSLVFEEHTQIDDPKRQYKENASNFLYDFNFKFNNIIKTTLLTITIKKKIINLFAPGKNYYMTVKLYNSENPDIVPVNIQISVCTSFGNDTLEDALNQINSQLLKQTEYIDDEWFINVNNKEKTFTLKLSSKLTDFTNVQFLNKNTCNYVQSLAFKLNLLHTEFASNYSADNYSINFPEFLYFLYDDLTNNYHTSYYASTRDSSLPSTVLAFIPLVGDEYKLENSGSDLDTYSREYFGKINIEKARFQLLSPDGDLVNIDQTDYVENNYFFKLISECIYDN